MSQPRAASAASAASARSTAASTTPARGTAAPDPAPSGAGPDQVVPTQGAAATTGGPRAGAGRPGPGGPAGVLRTPIAPASASSSSLPRYRLSTRVSDWLQARADGRAGLPSLEPGRPTGTPTLEGLAQDFLDRSHRERLRLDVELAPLLEADAQLVARIAEVEQAVARAETRLAQWPVLPDPEALTRRRGGEARTADDVVAARRAREYDALRRPLVTEEASLHSTLAALRVERARVRTAIRAREVVGATRVRRLHAQTMRRISTYERHLVRRHPAGDRIGPALAVQHPVVPGWVALAEEPPEPDPPTGDAVGQGHA